MLIWLLAIIFLGVGAAVGYRQGAIKAAVSFCGLLLAAILAVPLSGPIASLLGVLGLKSALIAPFIKPLIAPAIVFILVVIVGKIAAHMVHEKISVFYKYKAIEERRFRWERMNERVGICLGLLNGTFYFFVVLIPIYVLGYLTVQLAAANNPAPMRLLNEARNELQSSKMDRAVAAHDPTPKEVYNAFDILGLIYNNSQLESRLARYPVFLGVSERPEFQDLANDIQFHELWQGGASVSDLLKHPKVQTLTTNGPLVDQLRNILAPNLDDLKTFLETGKSKYDSEPLLGRWNINLNEIIIQEKQNRRSITGPELRQFIAKITPYNGATLIVTPENQLFLKRGAQAPGAESMPRYIAEGSWSKDGAGYKFTLDSKVIAPLLDDHKLLLTRDGINLIFDRDL
jgi:hypothetical protein